MRTRLLPGPCDQLAEWSTQTGVRLEIWALPEADLPLSLGDALRDLLDEILDRVARAAHVRTLSVAITASASSVRVTVSHDGSGVAPGREEASGPWGRMRCNTVIGAGTTYSAEIPVARNLLRERSA
ncbi:hypothetical protein ACIBHX_49385 [Nonomuraea sp. NPDC050536]|uniref:hypothetical protein n=1 Tax=Nonomuraea sp. NPDC050536 TaxID=3364366 RepID=UPI0037C71E9A